MPAARSLRGSVSPAMYRVSAPVRKLRAYEPRMALSLLVMVFYVAVYFLFDSVEAVGNDSVVFVLSLEASMNKSDNNREQPSNDNSQ